MRELVPTMRTKNPIGVEAGYAREQAEIKLYGDFRRRA